MWNMIQYPVSCEMWSSTRISTWPAPFLTNYIIIHDIAMEITIECKILLYADMEFFTRTVLLKCLKILQMRN